MKKLLLILLCLPMIGFSQSKKELKRLNKTLLTQTEDLLAKYHDCKDRHSKLIADYDLLTDQHSKLVADYDLLVDQHSVSFDTPENYAKSIFKLLKNKKKDEASKLLFSIDNSKYFSDKLNKVLRQDANRDSISIIDWIQNFNNDNIKSFDKVYYEGINMGINWQNANFQKTEFSIEYESDIDTYMIDNYKVFFNSSNKDYYFKIKSVLIINDQLNNWRLRGPYDIQAEKIEKEKKEIENQERKKQREIELKNQPYKPYKLFVDGSNWTYNLDKIKTFKEFRCRITNNTEHFVNRVKFRISIYTGAAFTGGKKVFSKTYDLEHYYPRGEYVSSTKPLELAPGDVQEIQIKELIDFYLGEDVREEKKWYSKYEVLAVYPKQN